MEGGAEALRSTGQPTRDGSIPHGVAGPGPTAEAAPRGADQLHFMTRVLLGATSWGASRLWAALPTRRVAPDESSGAMTSDLPAPSTPALLAFAALALGMEVERRAVAVVTGGGTVLAAVSGVLVRSFPATTREAVGAQLRAWGARGRAEQAANEHAAAMVASAALGDVLDAVLDSVDWERIAAHVDVDALVHRLDLAAMAKGIVEDGEMGELIRESAGSLAVETVSAARVQSAAADTTVARVVDRLLRRRAPRELEIAPGPTRADVPPASPRVSAPPDPGTGRPAAPDAGIGRPGPPD